MERAVLTAREARDYLRISARLLWQLSAPRGPIPVARAGKKLLYGRADLDRFLADSAARSLEAAGSANDSPRSDMEAMHGQKKSPGTRG